GPAADRGGDGVRPAGWSRTPYPWRVGGKSPPLLRLLDLLQLGHVLRNVAVEARRTGTKTRRRRRPHNFIADGRLHIGRRHGSRQPQTVSWHGQQARQARTVDQSRRTQRQDVAPRSGVIAWQVL